MTLLKENDIVLLEKEYDEKTWTVSKINPDRFDADTRADGKLDKHLHKLSARNAQQINSLLSNKEAIYAKRVAKSFTFFNL
jgi:hypothetical protein